MMTIENSLRERERLKGSTRFTVKLQRKAILLSISNTVELRRELSTKESLNVSIRLPV